MLWPARAGVNWGGRGPSLFGLPAGNVHGNNLPGFTGALDRPSVPAPGPGGGGGNAGGGTGDQYYGADPRVERIQPDTRQTGIKPFQEQGRDYGNPGWNDKLTVKDRHAYWDTGRQLTGTDEPTSGGNPNSWNRPRSEPPRPDLRLTQRTVSYQKGSDHTANQDDLTRPYTWLGEQGSGWVSVYGGVPGLYQPYGSRGGIPYPVVAPVEQGAPGDGPHRVFSGPPHGLHSETPWKGGAQIIARFSQIPQTRPVRQDRPSNSPQAGQSYSQTVLPQGASPVRPAGGAPGRGVPGAGAWPGGRGWAGRGGQGTSPGGSWLGRR